MNAARRPYLGTLLQEEVGVVCSFKYRCSGGTGENWKIRLMPLESNRFLCSVGRPNPPSYLLTSHFTLAVEPVDESTTIKLADANLQVRTTSLMELAIYVDADPRRSRMIPAYLGRRQDRSKRSVRGGHPTGPRYAELVPGSLLMLCSSLDEQLFLMQ